MTSKLTWLVAALSLALAGGALALVALGGLGENLIYYWSPKELLEAGDRALGASIRLGGQVAVGTVHQEPGGEALTFTVTDGAHSVPVRAVGIPPQMFREGIGVVVEGTFTRKGLFEGRRLMVSHGNEYRAPTSGEVPDVKALMRSMEQGAPGTEATP